MVVNVVRKFVKVEFNPKVNESEGRRIWIGRWSKTHRKCIEKWIWNAETRKCNSFSNSSTWIAGTWKRRLFSISPCTDSVFVGQWLSGMHCPPAVKLLKNHFTVFLGVFTLTHTHTDLPTKTYQNRFEVFSKNQGKLLLGSPADQTKWLVFRTIH